MDVSDRKVSVGEGLRESEKGMKNVVVCVCVCVCEREGERERGREGERERESTKLEDQTDLRNWKNLKSMNAFFENFIKLEKV